MKTWTVEEILEMLTRQPFADFYADDGPFGRWLMGDENAPTKEQVIERLEKLLGLRKNPEN